MSGSPEMSFFSSWLTALLPRLRAWWASHRNPTEAEMATRAFSAGRADYERGILSRDCEFVRPEERALWRLGYDYQNRVEISTL